MAATNMTPVTKKFVCLDDVYQYVMSGAPLPDSCLPVVIILFGYSIMFGVGGIYTAWIADARRQYKYEVDSKKEGPSEAMRNSFPLDRLWGSQSLHVSW